MFSTRRLRAFALAILLGSFGRSVAHAQTSLPVVDHFADLLTGVYDSSSQSIDDSSYLDVTVRHCAVTVTDLPPDMQSGRFLALRQSVSTDAKPYRVRVLRIFEATTPETVRTSSFAVIDGRDITDLCFKADSERVVSFNQLSEEKCATEARRMDGRFVGGTTGSGCPSARAGAVRMTSELTLDEKTMTTWDRGWTADGRLAWGPESGPYRFEKVSGQDVRLAQLAAFFSGRFSNAEQVAQDPKNFLPVSYEFCQVDAAINPLRPATRVMLAQQTITTPARTIERKRLYEFFRTASNQIAIRTNPFDETKVPADVCRRSLAERRALAEEVFSQRDACVLTFEWNQDNESFVGGTPEGGCASNFQGAVKFTLEEVIKDGVISPWERWFNAQGEQVAGSKTGPYVYKRILDSASNEK